jgi:hypothetical protein
MTEMKAKTFKVGDRVRIQKIPSRLSDSAGIDTPGVFSRALGKTFRVAGIAEEGHLELEVTKHDTIWIEPEFVARVERRRKSK